MENAENKAPQTQAAEKALRNLKDDGNSNEEGQAVATL